MFGPSYFGLRYSSIPWLSTKDSEADAYPTTRLCVPRAAASPIERRGSCGGMSRNAACLCANVRRSGCAWSSFGRCRIVIM
jgi:hypothetical protein